ncbi:hypothetical protein K438DRAFT_1785805 [Mycena galopus ATCC 62051]|nr:hypothetical protein K438DRAFT_1785805 [Mycena galopus ATCC 62051]
MSIGWVYDVKREELTPYRSGKGNAATEDELAELTAACQKATFGVGGADVFDKSYRKARKMDLGPPTYLMQGQTIEGNKSLKAEMYKLNVASDEPVYEEQQATTWSPHALLIRQTGVYVGVALTLEHAEKTRVFDSAAELASAPHTLSLVCFGNIFSYAEDDYERRIPPGPTPLGPVLRLLEGRDARIRTVSERVELVTHVKVMYASGENYDEPFEGHDVMGDDLAEGGIERMGMRTLLQRGPERTRQLRENLDRKHGDYVGEILKEEEESDGPAAGNGFPVHWVTKITDLTRVGSSYIAYGNEASLHTRHAALFVQVPAVRKSSLNKNKTIHKVAYKDGR